MTMPPAAMLWAGWQADRVAEDEIQAVEVLQELLDQGIVGVSP